MYSGTLGVGLISSGRPAYLSRVLTNLEQSFSPGSVDYHLFQDGHTNKFSGRLAREPGEISACLRRFGDSSLPSKATHTCEYNVGVAINQFEAYEFMTARYEHVLFLEDDALPSRFLLRLTRLLADQLYTKVPNAFSFHFGLHCWVADKRPENLRHYRPFFRTGHYYPWPAVYFRSSIWRERIKPVFMPYYAIVSNCDYRERRLVAKRITECLRKLDPDCSDRITSQDHAKNAATVAAGLVQCEALIGRVVHIGEHGEHNNPQTYKERRWADGLSSYSSSSDRTMAEWKLWPTEANPKQRSGLV